MNHPLRSMLLIFDGLSLIMQKRLRRYVVWPFVLNVSVFLALLVWGTTALSQWVEQIMPQLPAWLAWLEWVLWLLLTAALTIGLYMVSIVTANIIAAPFNSLLAERLLQQHSPQHNETSASEQPQQNVLTTLGRDMIGSFRHEAAKLLYFVSRAVPIGLLFFIPGINLAAPLIWLLFAAWMMGLEYLDYPAGCRQVTFPQLRQQARHRSLHVLGFGLASMALTLVPILNFVAIPASVAGATKLWLHQFNPPSAHF